MRGCVDVELGPQRLQRPRNLGTNNIVLRNVAHERRSQKVCLDMEHGGRRLSSRANDGLVSGIHRSKRRPKARDNQFVSGADGLQRHFAEITLQLAQYEVGVRVFYNFIELKFHENSLL